MKYFQFRKMVKSRRCPYVVKKAVIEFTPAEAWQLYKSLLIPSSTYATKTIEEFKKSFVCAYEKFNINHNLDSIP